MTFEWLKADTIRLLPQWHSDAMNIKPILIVLEERGYPVVGWYFGGLLNEFRMDGSPSKQFPTHWAPMPPKP